MNYKKIYEDLIEDAKRNPSIGYTEKHHKIPRSIGGADTEENLIVLSARQHYIAHLLLCKIHKDDEIKYRKLLYAFMCMRFGRIDGKRSFNFNSRLYSKMKTEYSKIRSTIMIGEGNPMVGKKWIYSLYEKKNMVVDKSITELPEGYVVGRCNDFEKRLKTLDKLGISIEQFLLMKRRVRLNKKNNDKLNLELSIERKRRAEESRKEKELKIQFRDNLLYDMYCDYLNSGFDYVKSKYNYTKTRENLIIAFKRHVKEYSKGKLLKTTVAIKKERGGYNQPTKNRKLSIEEKQKYFSDMYIFFKENGFEKTVEKYSWTSTRNAMIMNFRNYVPDYIPTKCNRWKNK